MKNQLHARLPQNRAGDDRSNESDDSSDFESPVRPKPPPESEAATDVSSSRAQNNAASNLSLAEPSNASTGAPSFHLMCDDDDSSAGSDSEESLNASSQDCNFDVECMGTQPRNATPEEETTILEERKVSAGGPTPTAAMFTSAPLASSSSAPATTPWSFLKTSNAAPISSRTPAQSKSQMEPFEETPLGSKRPYPTDCEPTPMATPSVTAGTSLEVSAPSAEVSAEAAAGAFLEAAHQRSARQHGAPVPVSLVQENPKRNGTKTAARYE